MELAYYISAHHKPYQFRWIFSSVYDDAGLFLVHVDSKSPDSFDNEIRSITSGRDNVVHMPRSVVNWGGWSQVANELRAIRLALDLNKDWRYFINLSGQDYPIQSRLAIDWALEEAWPRSFIRAWSFDRVRSREPNDPHLAKRASIEAFGAVRQLPFRLPETGLETDYKGSQWHMLTREFCQWLLSDPVARRLGRHFRFSHCPDETFFQAAIMNSPFRELRMADCGRLFFFPGPRTLGVADLTTILSSSDLFARKFDAAVDREVLEAIAAERGYPTAP